MKGFHIPTKKMARVYLGRLPHDVNRMDVEDFVKGYGVIRDIWIARNPGGFGFVIFEDRRDAEDAVRDLNGRTLLGQRVFVQFARDQNLERRSGAPRDGPRDAPRRGRSRSPDYGDYRRDTRRSRSRERPHEPPRGGRGGRSPSPPPPPRRSRSRDRSRERDRPDAGRPRSPRRSRSPVRSRNEPASPRGALRDEGRDHGRRSDDDRRD